MVNMVIEAKLAAMGLFLPSVPGSPDLLPLQFAWAKIYGNRVYLSGHAAQKQDGSLAELRGKVGTNVNLEQAQEASRFATLSFVASLKRSIGDLDRVSAWLTVSGMVNVAPDFLNTTGVIDGCSALLLELFGPDIGAHARTAIGVSQLPLNSAVVIAAEVAFSS